MCDYFVEGEEPQLQVERMQRARRRYVCCECSQPINPGETYEYAFMVTDREPDYFRTCHVCATIRAEYFERWTYGDLAAMVDWCLGVDLC